MSDITPRQALEYEYAVCGAIIRNNGTYPAVSRRLQARMFYREATRRLYEAICRRSDAREPVDMLTLLDAMAGPAWDNIPARLTIASALEQCASPRNAGYYAEQVRRAWIERQAIHLCERAIERMGDEADPARVLQIVQEQAAKLRAELDAEDGDPPTADLLNEVLDELDGQATRIRYPLGLPGIGHLIRGWHPGELAIIAAAPSVGKTAVCTQIVQAVARAGHRCLFVSAEMPPKAIIRRILSQVSGLSYEAVDGAASVEQISEIGKASALIADWPLRVCRPRTNHADAVCALIDREKPALCVVDYLQLLTGEGENRTQQVGRALAQIKSAGLSNDCTVIVASQVSRAAMTESNGRPRLHHLRESGEIEAHADIVVMLWRDKDEVTAGTHVRRNLAVEKHRNGPTGTAAVMFNGVCARWENSCPE